MLSRLIEELGVDLVEDLSRARVKAWREKRLAAGASNKTVNNQLAVLLAALACAVESELIEAHPLAGLKSLPVGPRHQRRKPRALAEWEIVKLLAAMAEMDGPKPTPGPTEPRESPERAHSGPTESPVVRPDPAGSGPTESPEWLTVKEASQLVGVSWRTVSRRAQDEAWACGSAIRGGKPARTVRAADVLEAFPAPPRVPQELLVRVLIETGARWGELTLATWADVDLAGGTLVLRAENTKTDQERAIPLRRETCEALVAYRLECAAVLGAMPSSSSLIFLSPKGRPWTSGSNFRKVLGAAYERAGLLVRDERGHLRSKDGHALHVHTLRHTCCTRLLAAGVPVPIVQAVMGHASPQMTLRVYSHLKAESARSFIEAVGAPVAAHVARVRAANAR